MFLFVSVCYFVTIISIFFLFINFLGVNFFTLFLLKFTKMINRFIVINKIQTKIGITNCGEEITKSLIYVLQTNLDDEKRLRNALLLANFKLLR